MDSAFLFIPELYENDITTSQTKSTENIITSIKSDDIDVLKDIDEIDIYKVSYGEVHMNLAAFALCVGSKKCYLYLIREYPKFDDGTHGSRHDIDHCLNMIKHH